MRTLEASLTNENAGDALYEFTRSFDLIRASYSERYWEMHRTLESRVGATGRMENGDA